MDLERLRRTGEVGLLDRELRRRNEWTVCHEDEKQRWIECATDPRHMVPCSRPARFVQWLPVMPKWTPGMEPEPTHTRIHFFLQHDRTTAVRPAANQRGNPWVPEDNGTSEIMPWREPRAEVLAVYSPEAAA